MAIEGPLRELGIHDVFQLLDLSRKTGTLRVRSALRDNDGQVHFSAGRVVGASMRDGRHELGAMLVQAGRVTPDELDRARRMAAREREPRRLGDVLVANGAIAQRELDRHVRRQIEAVVFELLSWSEGFFSFEEGSPPADAMVADAGLTTEALLMEAARRIDEWTRMADRVPDATVVPALADADGGQAASLDLRPAEWQVLAAIDGASDVRSIAVQVGQSEFDVARVVYGLVTTGVVTVTSAAAAPVTQDALVLLSDAREAARDGRASDALVAAERATHLAPWIAEAHALAGVALLELHRFDEAEQRLRQALSLEGDRQEWLMPAARLAIRRGDLSTAVSLWERVVAVDPEAPAAAQARDALDQATRLHAMAGGTNGR